MKRNLSLWMFVLCLLPTGAGCLGTESGNPEGSPQYSDAGVSTAGTNGAAGVSASAGTGSGGVGSAGTSGAAGTSVEQDAGVEADDAGLEGDDAGH
jgi:hypothetical protein